MRSRRHCHKLTQRVAPGAAVAGMVGANHQPVRFKPLVHLVHNHAQHDLAGEGSAVDSVILHRPQQAIAQYAMLTGFLNCVEYQHLESG